MYFSLLGRNREALAELQQARIADPLSSSIEAHFGWISYRAHQYDLAIQQFGKLVDSDPTFHLTHSNLAWVYLQKGMYQQAIAEFERAGELRGERREFLDGLGLAYALSGQHQRALQVIQEVERRAKTGNVPSAHIALIYSGLGDKDRAVQFLTKAYEERYPWLTRLKLDPNFDSLRSDPRFEELSLVSKLGQNLDGRH